MDEDRLVDALWEMAHQLPDAMAAVVRRCHLAGLKAPILDKVLDGVAARCADQLRLWKLDPVGQDEP